MYIYKYITGEFIRSSPLVRVSKLIQVMAGFRSLSDATDSDRTATVKTYIGRSKTCTRGHAFSPC